MKKVLILASGGLDSTYLVWDNLNKGNSVTAMYIEITNNHQKVIVEKKCLLEQEKVFKTFFPKAEYNLQLDNVSFGVNNMNTDLVFSQMPIWLTSLLFFTNGFDEIQLGYVMNDDAISYLDEVKSIYNQYKVLCYEKDSFPKLIFPLSKKKKYEMLRDLSSEFHPLLTFCEWPNVSDNEKIIIPCGNICAACKRYNYEEIYKSIMNPSHSVYTITPDLKSDPESEQICSKYSMEQYGVIDQYNCEVKPYIGYQFSLNI